MFLGYAVLALVLPTGRLPAGRWRPALIALLLVNLALAALMAIAPMMSVTVDGGARTVLVPNPFAVAPDAPIWSMLPDTDLALAPVMAMLAIGVASIIVRYRRSTGGGQLSSVGSWPR